MKLKFLGICRKPEFSPNHEINDELIIKMTAEKLKEMGATVQMSEEGCFVSEEAEDYFIFSMTQGPKGTNELMKVLESNVRIINSPQSVANCYRENMIRIIPANNIPFPKSVMIGIDEVISYARNHKNMTKFWIKRFDVHAVTRDDVVLVSNIEELIFQVSKFQERNVKKVVIQEHLEGDCIKFYGIRERNFFEYYYTETMGKYNFELMQLKYFANESAKALGLYVYGGDAIITPNGDIYIIDINDWPSFAKFREKASSEIASLIYNKALQYEKSKVFINQD